MIRFIIETHSSATDRNGNRYHFARVTSTLTGKSLRINSVAGKANIPHLVMRTLNLEWGDIKDIEISHPIREWQRKKNAALEFCYEHQITRDTLKALEVTP